MTPADTRYTAGPQGKAPGTSSTAGAGFSLGDPTVLPRMPQGRLRLHSSRGRKGGGFFRKRVQPASREIHSVPPTTTTFYP